MFLQDFVDISEVEQMIDGIKESAPARLYCMDHSLLKRIHDCVTQYVCGPEKSMQGTSQFMRDAGSQVVLSLFRKLYIQLVNLSHDTIAKGMKV
jgi:hypothetical protein